jgi:hypothetical protein
MRAIHHGKPGDDRDEQRQQDQNNSAPKSGAMQLLSWDSR